MLTGEEIFDILHRIPRPDFMDARTFQIAFYNELKDRNYPAVMEYVMKFGRIDIVIGNLEIELDNASPRARSIKKLKAMPLGGFVVMRKTGVVTRIWHEEGIR